MQYGISNDGGSSGTWSIANWFEWFDANGFGLYASSQAVSVNVGTNLTGVINMTGQETDGSYDFTSSYTGYSNSLTVVEGYYGPHNDGKMPKVPLMNYALLNFTAIASGGGVPPVSNYPGGNYMAVQNIQVTTASGNSSLNWIPEDQTYGAKPIVVSNSSPGGEVHLYFRDPGFPPAPVITSVGKWHGGAGATGTIIVSFTYSISEYHPITGYNIQTDNLTKATTVTDYETILSGHTFTNPPSGTVTGDNLRIKMQPVYQGGGVGPWSNSLTMTY